DLGSDFLSLGYVRPGLHESRIVLSLTCSSIISLVGEIVFGEHGGYTSPWRGNLVFIVHRLAFYGVNYFAYLNFNKLLLTSSTISSSLSPASVAIISGGLATLTATLISHPLDTLRTHITLLKTSDKYEGAWKTFRNVYRDGGLYAGISASLLGVIPSVVISFFCV
ncbi:Adenine nucleotide transporter BT1, chloroplastic/mitochondrial, partial [Linum perenne]